MGLALTNLFGLVPEREESNMAIIQNWELSQYQYAAEQMCQRLGESPHEMLMDENGQHVPRWMGYAIKMHELRLMVDLMRQDGIPL